LTNGTADADYTTHDVIVTVPAGATTGTVSVPTTADTIDEVDETSALLMELGYGYNYRQQQCAYCGNDHSCFGYRRI
jgi:hypothetical protein